MRKKKICFVILMIVSLLILSACSNDSENLEVNKGLSEVGFLENQCISIFSKYISDEYLLDNGQVDWTLISSDFGVVRNSIDVILIDLAGLQVPSKDIVELENNFRQLDSFIQNKDINGFMKGICDIYSIVSNSVLDSISKDEKIKLEKKSKSNLIYIGYDLMTYRKDEAIISLEEFQKNYSELSINTEYIEDNSYKINRIFVDIQKLRTEIENENFEAGKKELLEIMDFF